MYTKIKGRYIFLLAIAVIVLMLFWLPVIVITLLIAAVVLCIVPATRLWCFSTPLYHLLKKSMPPVSDTEREVIESGSTWWEKSLFQGQPDWSGLLSLPSPKLNEAEQGFLDNETEELCNLVDDWQIKQQADLSHQAWEFIKTRRFFGMIIPKYYGGLGFSNAAHSAVITKLASRSAVLATTVMVPNSLGPAELLLKYGSDKQKSDYLPKLARGEEVPCFALTSLHAGSDAGSIDDFGVVCEDEFDGQRCLGLRLTWRKRYITLAPVATLIGLAVKVVDPQQLLDKDIFHGNKELGITCVLVPANTPGVNKGQRHSPLDTLFQNGPTSGEGVFVPLDYVIGGMSMIGQGWRMLVECLVIGRSLSIPALASSAQQNALYTSNAYGRLREQFRLPIAKFEGVQKELAQLAMNTTTTDAMRLLTVAAIDDGHKPAVVSAIVKYYSTENARHSVNIAMDIHGGKAIMQGPKNYLASIYKSIPIIITVEGANILTRSLMIFGQGALRCHPYLYSELKCFSDQSEKSIADFNSLLGKHTRYFLKTLVKARWTALTKARFSSVPADAGTMRKHYRNVNYISALFAFLSNLIILTSGGGFKKKEIISGYFSDVLAMMYATGALLKQHHNRLHPEIDKDLTDLACSECIQHAEATLHKICLNLPKPFNWLSRFILFPLGKRIRGSSEQSYSRLAQQLYSSDDLSTLLTPDIHRESFAHLSNAVSLSREVTELRSQLKAYPRAIAQDNESWLSDLQQQGIISSDECDKLKSWQQAVDEVLEVDSFDSI
ncbi:MAG: acyl-CoA dehydrogenase [Chromatiales bacterium]|nr:acyl-CoA dehydrogenase [Chromatiales bacterium]